MSKAIRVRYEERVLKPLELVDLREGEERIAVLVPVGEERRRILRSIGAYWAGRPRRR